MKEKIKNIIIILLIVILGFSIYFNLRYFKNLNSLNTGLKKSLQPYDYFLMSNNLSCEVKLSSNKENVGRTLSLLDLQTDNPKMLSGRGGTSPMTKFFESEETLVFGLIASSGSTDIFVLNKKNGIFARTESGNLLGVFSVASKGVCK